MRVAILFSLFLLFMSTSTFAHNDIGISLESIDKKKGSGKFDKSRLFVGGGLNAGGLPGGFLVTALPSVGYAFTQRFHAGFSFGGTYYNFAPEPYYPNYKERGMNYQTAVFARYFVINSIFLQIRPEYNNTKVFRRSLNTAGQIVGTPSRSGLMSFLVGAGYAQRIGGMSYGMFTVMYDLIQNPNSPYYRQPIFGGGFALGIFGGR